MKEREALCKNLCKSSKYLEFLNTFNCICRIKFFMAKICKMYLSVGFKVSLEKYEYK